MENEKAKVKLTKKQLAVKIIKLFFTAVFTIIFVFLLVTAALKLFKKDYEPSLFGLKAYSVVSDSMEPEIMTGTLIFVTDPPASTDINIGDVITYRVTGTGGSIVITHRVVKIYEPEGERTERAFTTKGDNAGGEDQYIVYYENILGVYSGSKIPVMGYVFGFFSSFYGMICLILVFFVIVVAMYAITFFEKGEAEEEAKKGVIVNSDKLVYSLIEQHGEEPELVALDHAMYLLQAAPDSRQEKKELQQEMESFASIEPLNEDANVRYQQKRGLLNETESEDTELIATSQTEELIGIDSHGKFMIGDDGEKIMLIDAAEVVNPDN